MTLSAGARLGPYEILAPIGAGGMGEVYKARDTRLERTVAIKVLPQHLSSSPELRQRFEREAKTISRLSHPHVCALYDVGNQDGTEYLVMELLEGATLTDRLGKGALPLEQTLRFGVEIADALEKAHREGIVHRDLKPGNVMLTRSGVKLLDFGLAKAFQSTTIPSALTALPTQANLTQEGMILGTFQYMAPEQLEGKEADARTDIFALGAVLYEMATGRKAFSGSSQASLISSIMQNDPPPISTVQPMTPPALDRVVRKALAKDPEERWQSAADLASELKWISEGSGAGVAAPTAVVSRRQNRERLAWGIAAAALVAAILATLGYLRRAPAPTPRIQSYLLSPAKTDFSLVGADGGSLTVSPDGRFATFATHPAGGKSILWLQPLAGSSPRPVPGAEDAKFPFWSADSRFLAFFADAKLQKVDVSGGPPLTVCDAPDGRSGAWNRDGVILFSPDPTNGIFRVPAAGGRPTPVTTLDDARRETTHRWVTFLPDGKLFLYMAGTHGAGTKSETNAIYAASLDSKERTLLLQARSNAVYASGRLLYVREGVLLAQRFDPETRKLSGDPEPVAEGVQHDPGYFHGSFAASEDGGLLLYATGAGSPKTQLRFYDLAGKPIGESIGEPAEYTSLSVSFDGSRIAAGIADASNGLPNIWLFDPRGARSRLTTGIPTDFPAWSPAGDRVAYAKLPGRGSEVCVKPITGGSEEILARFDDLLAQPSDWSRDGRFLALEVSGPAHKTGRDIWIIPMTGDRKPFAFLASDSDERSPSFSPDGRWLSFVSNESGRPEVYVVPFPGPGGKWQISTEGTAGGGFSGKGLEVFFGNVPTNEATAVELQADAKGLEVGSPRPLFKMPNVSAIAVSHDGQRFLLAVPPGPREPARIALISNWTAGLPK